MLIHQVSLPFNSFVLQVSSDIPAPGIYMGVRTAPYHRPNGHSYRRSPSPDRKSSHRRHRHRYTRSRFVDFYIIKYIYSNYLDHILVVEVDPDLDVVRIFNFSNHILQNSSIQVVIVDVEVPATPMIKSEDIMAFIPG